MTEKQSKEARMTVDQYRQMKADDPFKPVVVMPPKARKKSTKGKK